MNVILLESVENLGSIGDLVKFLSMEREIEIRYLTDYISGRYPACRSSVIWWWI